MAEIRIRTMQNLQVAPVLSNGSYNLAGADLQNAHLNGAKLIGADLSGANLTRAALIDADLSGANLTGAKLITANLAHANLSGANLSGADLTRANTTGVILNNSTIFQDDTILNGTYGVINIRSVAERKLELELERRELQRIQHATTPWVEDTDCDKDAIDIINTFEIIPEGRRFKFENDRKAKYKTCYDVESLAQMVKHHRESRSRAELKTPLSQFKFTEKDIRRIEDYMRRNPIGGKKRKTYKKTNKKRKAKKVTRKNRRKQNKK